VQQPVQQGFADESGRTGDQHPLSGEPLGNTHYGIQPPAAGGGDAPVGGRAP
jgi:hypothetical protein